MRAALESLLRARKLDVTLPLLGPDGEAFAPVRDAANTAPTGVADLDLRLGGGLPRGHVSEIVGPPSSGRSTLAVQALAAATDRGEAVALVDAGDTFDAADAADHGVALSHLLWVRPAGDPDATRGLKAFSLILQAGGFGLVVFDVADVAPLALRRYPHTTWMRLARIVEGSDTAALLVAGEHLARSAGGVTIAMGAMPARWRGATHRARVFTGIEPSPRVMGGRR